MLAIDNLTPEQLNRLFDMDSLIKGHKDAAAKTRALRAYYDGEHPVMLTARQIEIIGPLLEGNEFPGWAHNHVKSVVDTPRSRLAVTSVGIEGLDEKDTTSPAAVVSAAMWDWWKQSRLDSEQISVYRRAIREGVTYVMVDFDAENMRPRFSLHHVDAGEQEPGVILFRDPRDKNKVLCAVFRFKPDNPLDANNAVAPWRMNIYLPDQVRKYVQDKAGAWVPHMDTEDTMWPIVWMNPLTGKPIGIPVIEFATPGGALPTQIIPLQNLLNKTWLDLIAAADTHGFPMLKAEYDSSRLGPRVGGAESDADLEGADEQRISAQRLIEVDDGTVDRIQPGDLSQLIATIDRTEQAISGMTGIPMYYLRPVGGSEVPSGEALKQLESRLVALVQELQLMYGQSWEDVFKVAYAVNQAFGPSLPDLDTLNIAVEWQDANVRNDQVIASTAESHQRLGVPQATLWRMLGYTPEQIEQFQQAAAQAQAQQVSTIAAALRTTQTGAQAQGGNNGRQPTPTV